MARNKKKNDKSRLRVILGRIGLGVLTLFTLILLSIVIAGVVIVVKYEDDILAFKNEANAIVEDINASTFRSREETRIYDRDGQLISAIAEREYEYVEHDSLGENIVDAFVAVEDARFYEHRGIDLRSIFRAGFEYVRNRGEITQGGSTITQQLAKNVFLTHDQNFERKIKEMFVALRLESMYSKEEILEFYLNNIYFGRGAYGVQTAARTYFDKDVDELSISEAATITALTNNPTVYDPVTNPERAESKRNSIITTMRNNGFISEEDYRNARYSELEVHVAEEDDGDNLLSSTSYPVTFIVHSATEQLMREEGFEFDYWFDTKEEKDQYQQKYEEQYQEHRTKINSGGLNIYSTIDLDKQLKLQDSVNRSLQDYSNEKKENGIYSFQGSAVTIDNRTGDVLAVVGGRSQQGVSTDYNRAYQSYRQPGSAIKPVLVYTPAFERGITPDTRIEDSEIEEGPSNYDNRYRGMVTISNAIKYSYNTIPYKIIQEFGVMEFMTYLEEMEFSNLDPNDRYPVTSIGGFTYGTNAVEMAAAFSTIARTGMYIRPVGIEKIETSLGDQLYENKEDQKEVYEYTASKIMTEELRRVVEESGGTGYGTRVSNMPSAGKTGTTNDYRDSWFIGYTPYYTTSVWVGKDNSESLNMSERRGAKDIWRDYMNEIHRDLERIEFE